MALGMTSYEPVVNLSALARLYTREKIDARSHFIYLTLPSSLLDVFADVTVAKAEKVPRMGTRNSA